MTAAGPVLVLLGEVGFVFVGLVDGQALRRNGARPAALMLLAVAVVLALLLPASYLVVDWPVWLRWGFAVPLAVVSLGPGSVIALTGGPQPRWGLAKAAREIGERWAAIVKADKATEEDEAWLSDKARDLDRWRSPGTAELIDLYQAKVLGALESRDPDALRVRAAALDQRIAELIEQMYGDLSERNRRS